ncbi:PP2C family protein-serine/threonine phosphatase [Streptomyces poonensis]|uniref:PP2C family protein-serine/threonine phosphatase n=1 Tax=Streptomyces poonensis TaxID=68255 RepID=UPI00167ACD84|nr:PP2C family protein-serine/threonine phosphatase [Streptomyces poonensis]
MGRAGRLRRPDLAGAHGELNTALHRLHLLAGLPSLTEVARTLSGAGISRSTIHDAFCSRRLPKWKVVDALVEVLSSQAPGGRPEEDLKVLYEVWLRAAQESDGRPGPEGRSGGGRETETRALLRALLPSGVLPVFEGVEMAARYLTATEDDRSGGDWFDVAPLEGGKLALAAGDVMGSSALSLSLMAQLRGTLNTLVHLGLPPHDALNRLSEQAHRLAGDQLATCLCALYDAQAGTVALSSAGHTPPVLLEADGTCTVLDVPTGLPIGLAADACETVTYDVHPGTTLFLLTDGLVSAPGEDIWEGFERLTTSLSRAQKAAETASPPLEDLVDVAMNALIQDVRHDDAVLLAARFS